MKIAGHDYLFEQNERLRNQLQNYNNVRNTESVTPVNNTTVSSNNIEDTKKTPENGVKVDFSTSARIGGESQTAKSFPTTNFSTSEDKEQTAETNNINSSVLNQYRFFVQSNQYEGSEGVVKRIFR